MSRPIKFRQPVIRNGVFESWHYWGWMGAGNFVGPMGKNHSPDNGYQFTGLTDIDGNDIHEGDILAERHREIVIMWEVTFHDGGFCVKQSQLYADRASRLRIIGNTTENPELIKELK